MDIDEKTQDVGEQLALARSYHFVSNLKSVRLLATTGLPL